MAYKVNSSFPGTVDNRVFISDVDYVHEDIIKTHQNYISQGDYTNASTYLNNQEDTITPVNANLINLIQNRISALQDYLLSEDKCDRCVYGSEPESPKNNTIWVDND